MRKKDQPLKISWTCPDCGERVEVLRHPYYPAIVNGPADNWSPEEGGDIEPTECPGCGKKIEL